MSGAVEIPALMRSVRTRQGGAVWEYAVTRMLGSGSAALVFECMERRLPADASLDATASSAASPLDAATEDGRRVALKRLKDALDESTRPRTGMPAINDPALQSGTLSNTVDFALAGTNTALEATVTDATGETTRAGDGGEQSSSDDPFGSEEARLLACGRGCPYIVHFDRGFVNRDGIAFIAMELMQGGSLFNHMRSETATRKGFPDAIAATYVAQVARALEHLHSRRIVHCDVKALNVFLSHDKRIAKLGDFGSAKQLKELPDLDGWCRPPQPSSKVPEGSAFWMAPERIAGVLHPCIDVWALGCLAIELLSGDPPFYDFDTAASVLNHLWNLDAAPLRLLDRLEHASEGARDFIGRCLQLHPTDRPTAAELLHHPWIASRAAPSRTPSPPRAIGVLPPTAATPPPSSADDLGAHGAGGVSASGSFHPGSGQAVGWSDAAQARGPTPPVFAGFGPAARELAETPTQSSALGRTDSQIFGGAQRNTTTAAAGGFVAGGRTQQRNSVLGVLESACEPKRPLALARWLIGAEDLDAVPNAAQFGGPLLRGTSFSTTAAPIANAADAAAATSAAATAAERRRAARESVALVVNEIADSVNAWRAFRNAHGGRQQSQTAPPAEGSADDAERESARNGAVGIVKLLSAVAAQWRSLALDMLRRRLSLAESGASIAEATHANQGGHGRRRDSMPPASSTADLQAAMSGTLTAGLATTVTGHGATSTFDEESFEQYERQTLEALPFDNAASALTLAWMLLDALAQSGFWAAAGDVREMFYGSVALAGGTQANFAASDVMSPASAGPNTNDSSDPFSPQRHPGDSSSGPPGAHGSYGDDAFSSSLASTYSHGMGGGGGRHVASGDEYSSGGGGESHGSGGGRGRPELDRVYDDVVLAIRDLALVSIASIACPSAAPFAAKLATQTAASPWALSMLLSHERHRRETLDVLAAALQCDRALAGQMPLLETVCAASLTRLGPEYVAGARLACAQPGAESSPLDGTFGANPSAATESGNFTGLYKTEWHMSDARGRLAAAVAPATRQHILTFISDGARPSRASEEALLRDTLICFNHLLPCAEVRPLQIALGAVGCGRLISCTQRDYVSACREGALCALLELALLDAEWTLRWVHIEPVLNGALERDVPEVLRFGLAAVVPSLCEDLPPSAFVGAGIPYATGNDGGSGGRGGGFFSGWWSAFSGGNKDSNGGGGGGGAGGAGAAGTSAGRGVTVDPGKLGALMSQHPSSPDTPDPALGALLKLLLSDQTVACRFAASHNFVRNVVGALQHADTTCNRWAREKMLDIVRVLFECTDDPARFADDNELCTSVVNIAQDPATTLHVTAAACELLNAFAHVVVF